MHQGACIKRKARWLTWLITWNAIFSACSKESMNLLDLRFVLWIVDLHNDRRSKQNLTRFFIAGVHRSYFAALSPFAWVAGIHRKVEMVKVNKRTRRRQLRWTLRGHYVLMCLIFTVGLLLCVYLMVSAQEVCLWFVCCWTHWLPEHLLSLFISLPPRRFFAHTFLSTFLLSLSLSLDSVQIAFKKSHGGRSFGQDNSC